MIKYKSKRGKKIQAFGASRGSRTGRAHEETGISREFGKLKRPLMGKSWKKEDRSGARHERTLFLKKIAAGTNENIPRNIGGGRKK